MAKPGLGILDHIGNTPLIALLRLVPEGSARVLAKWEGSNPTGSVKDRIVLSIIREAEGQGKISPGQSTLVEASSGNTALALASVGAALGYKVVLTMPEAVPLEQRRLLTRLGAEIRLTYFKEGMTGAQRAARELASREPDHFLLDQFANPANPKAHREGTFQEIMKAVGSPIDAFVAGVGTGGTITGVGEKLKEHNPSSLVVAVEPARSPLLSGGWFGEHRIPGLGADFVPFILNRRIIDEIIPIEDEEAIATMERLAVREGLLVGPSSGANVAAALLVAERLGPGKTVVTILPDRGAH
ncbi:MAG: cysteine synthase family protein [Chloroflexi bacterium]|nr:cysteine synthase family protein [Chloroflexota bacterium]